MSEPKLSTGSPASPAAPSSSIHMSGIEAKAKALGFDLVGVVPAGPSNTAGHYRAWLAKGYHGEMAYLARPDAAGKRADPALILSGVRSVVAVAANYHTAPLPSKLGDDPARGVLASYAWGADYHDLLLGRLRQLGAWVEAETAGAVAHRAYVDTGPVLERELAARAGLGFVGKNTNLIHPRLGSWLFLGVLLLTAEMRPSQPGFPTEAGEGSLGDLALPGETGMCGHCTRCLDACPTAAFPAPYVLDARRCISYLTIEHKGPIPRELRPLIGNRVFGCDICQEVCPWNRRFARPTAEPAFQAGAGSVAPPLLELIALDEDGFRHRFRGSPVRRAKRRGLLRNVCVALGNWGDRRAVPALARALRDPEPLIRGHAAWALGRMDIRDARRALEQALAVERDEGVRRELSEATAGS